MDTKAAYKEIRNDPPTNLPPFSIIKFAENDEIEIIRTRWAFFDEKNRIISSIFPNTQNLKELNKILNKNPEPESNWWDENGEPWPIKKFFVFASTFEEAMERYEFCMKLPYVSADDEKNKVVLKKTRHERAVKKLTESSDAEDEEVVNNFKSNTNLILKKERKTKLPKIEHEELIKSTTPTEIKSKISGRTIITSPECTEISSEEETNECNLKPKAHSSSRKEAKTNVLKITNVEVIKSTIPRKINVKKSARGTKTSPKCSEASSEEEAEESIFKPKAHFTTTMGAKVMPKNTNLELINTSNPTKMQKTLESYTECRQAPSEVDMTAAPQKLGPKKRPHPLSHRNREFNSKNLTPWQETVLRQITETGVRVDLLYKQACSGNNAGNCGALYSFLHKDQELKNFPIDDKKSFMYVEKKLKEEAFHNKIVHALVNVGKFTNASLTVTALMNELMTFKMAMTFCFEGRNQEKDAFKKTLLYSAVSKAALTMMSGESTNSIDHHISAWLSNSKLREKRRKPTSNPLADQLIDEASAQEE